MEFESAVQKIVQLAVAGGGTVTAAQIEADPDLAADRNIASAAGHMLAGGTNVMSFSEDDGGREWFPYSGLVFTEIRQPAS